MSQVDQILLLAYRAKKLHVWSGWQNIRLIKLERRCCVNGAVCLSKLWWSNNTTWTWGAARSGWSSGSSTIAAQKVTPALVPQLNLCHQLAQAGGAVCTGTELLLQNARNPQLYLRGIRRCFDVEIQCAKIKVLADDAVKKNLKGRVFKAWLSHVRISRAGLGSSNRGDDLVFGPASKQLSHHSWQNTKFSTHPKKVALQHDGCHMNIMIIAHDPMENTFCWWETDMIFPWVLVMSLDAIWSRASWSGLSAIKPK